jgi:hypothetical protein
MDRMRNIRRQKKAERLAQMTAAEKAQAASKRKSRRHGEK